MPRGVHDKEHACDLDQHEPGWEVVNLLTSWLLDQRTVSSSQDSSADTRPNYD